MSGPSTEEIARILEEVEDADEALRRVVALLVDEPGATWAGVAFLEDGHLTLGPSAGSPDEARRIRVPIVFQGDHVGELLVDGTMDPAVVAQIADRIAPQVLIGWDTGGEPWEP